MYISTYISYIFTSIYSSNTWIPCRILAQSHTSEIILGGEHPTVISEQIKTCVHHTNAIHIVNRGRSLLYAFHGAGYFACACACHCTSIDSNISSNINASCNKNKRNNRKTDCICALIDYILKRLHFCIDK